MVELFGVTRFKANGQSPASVQQLSGTLQLLHVAFSERRQYRLPRRRQGLDLSGSSSGLFKYARRFQVQDQGSLRVAHQSYASRAYRKLAGSFGMRMSMSRRANAWDNSPIESFFKTLKVEHVYQTRYETRAQARLDILDWIEGYYNRQRFHSSIGLCELYASVRCWPGSPAPRETI